MSKELLRSIPKMDVLLDLVNPKYMALIESKYIKQILDEVLGELRKNILEDKQNTFVLEHLIKDIEERLRALVTPSLKRVVNGTGIVLHTNLGRAVLSKSTVNAISPMLCGYNTLEYDVKTGRRGSRYSHIEKKLTRLTGAEAALVVNNNAAAVMLVLSTLAKNKKVVVSRGELVEIGGAFRIPDVMTTSGCFLREIGTTNKTHLFDYENAIDEETALLMKVHTSNYRVVGFTESVEAEALTSLGLKYNLPVYEDLGSGLMEKNIDLPWLSEPTVREKVDAGIDVISFSGDKLFGGGQCGIIIGKKNFIDPMKKNPLLRAFRIDKMSLAVLEQSLISYFNPSMAFKNIPTLTQLTESSDKTYQKTKLFLDSFKDELNGLAVQISIDSMDSEVGGGAMPFETIPSYGIVFKGIKELSKVQEKLRNYSTPIVAMASNDRLILNFKTIFEEDFNVIIMALNEAINSGGTDA